MDANRKTLSYVALAGAVVSASVLLMPSAPVRTVTLGTVPAARFAVQQSVDLMAWAWCTSGVGSVALPADRPHQFFRQVLPLRWDGDTNVDGFNVYVGSASRDYRRVYRVTNVLNFDLPVGEGVAYMAVTARVGGQESDFSDELTNVVYRLTIR